MLTDIDIILGMNLNLFSVMEDLKKSFQVTSEEKSLILKINTTKIHFDKRMANTRGNVFLFTLKIYKKPNNNSILGSKKMNLEEKEAADQK